MFPFSLIYGAITGLRNWAFDSGILTSTSFDLPIIAVGNLNVGGTGKSPMIEYLIRLLNKPYNLAVLSRGYGRKTKGYYHAIAESTANELGDEPFQFYRKFKDLTVVVSEKRVEGVQRLLEYQEPDVILLDDAFQHRKIKAGFYILLTAFTKLYADDMILPAGNLRESKGGAKRADIIIVSKCPLNITEEDRQLVLGKIKPQRDQKVFFSGIQYDTFVYAKDKKLAVEDLSTWRVLLVTGIADTKPLESFLRSREIEFELLAFSDHHYIGDQETKRINEKFSTFTGDKKMILTTEKDYVRSFLDTSLFSVYYLPIQTVILENGDEFNELIQNYVRKN